MKLLVVIHMVHQEWVVWITNTSFTENKKVLPNGGTFSFKEVLIVPVERFCTG